MHLLPAGRSRTAHPASAVARPLRLAAVRRRVAAVRRARARRALGASRHRSWLAAARAAGADAALVAASNAARRSCVCVDPPRRSPGAVVRALDAEAQLRPIDALVPFGARRAVLRRLCSRRELRGRARRARCAHAARRRDVPAAGCPRERAAGPFTSARTRRRSGPAATCATTPVSGALALLGEVDVLYVPHGSGDPCAEYLAHRERRRSTRRFPRAGCAARHSTRQSARRAHRPRGAAA